MADHNATITLSDGKSMPRIGYGTWRIGDDDAQAAVEAALAIGYRSLDTAEMYRNEVGVGRAIIASGLDRQSLFLTSKVWNDHHGYDSARVALDESLERLGTDYLDLYLIHWPDPAQDRYVETWQSLLDARDEGLIRSVGVSNFLPEHLKRLGTETGELPAVNQVELHPYFNQANLREWHAEHGVVTESWGPLGQRTGALFDEPALRAIAEAHEKTVPQVVLRWHLQHDCVVIPKSSNPERMRDNFAVFDFGLTDEEMARIDALDTGRRQGFHPDSR
jgi:2,5-diketo-D-gluconate reductase A